MPTTEETDLEDAPPEPPQLAPKARLVAMNQAAQQNGGTSEVSAAVQSCPVKRSWFSVTAVTIEDGTEKIAEGLTLKCQLPELGLANGVTSTGSPEVRFDDLDPGGSGEVLAASHDDEVWEVSSDIS